MLPLVNKIAATSSGEVGISSRVVAAILEHHQRPDGTVAVPAALQPYFGRASIG